MNKNYEEKLGYSSQINNEPLRNKQTKKLKAFFIAPLFIPLSLSLLLLINDKGGFISGEEGAMLVFLIGIPITYLSVLILGLPVYIMLEESKKLSYLSLFLSGGIAGSLVAFGLRTEGRFSFKDMSGGIPDNIIPIFLGISTLCGITAIIYGKIARGI